MSIGSGGAPVVEMPVLLVLLVVPQNLWVLGQFCSREFKLGFKIMYDASAADCWPMGARRCEKKTQFCS